jgi:hypothetical protein
LLVFLLGRAIPLLPLWAVRPVQSLSVCTKVHFPLVYFMYLDSGINLNYVFVFITTKWRTEQMFLDKISGSTVSQFVSIKCNIAQHNITTLSSCFVWFTRHWHPDIRQTGSRFRRKNSCIKIQKLKAKTKQLYITFIIWFRYCYRLRWSRDSVAFGTQVRGFAPGRSRRIFRAKKSSARLPSEGK